MRKLLIALALGAGLTASQAHAAGGPSFYEMKDHTFTFSNPFVGTFDHAQLRRGFQVYKEVCSSCHAMKQLSYRNLTGLGFNEDQVKDIASEYTVMDGPDDEGEMFERAAIPADTFVSPFPNKQAAIASNGGAYPPDLSLMAKARANGPNYLYALLTGYEDEVPLDFAAWYPTAHDGEEFNLGDLNFNKYFGGNKIAMANPIYDEAVEYEDGTEATADQIAEDVTAFLVWAASPELEARRSMGIKVMLFLVVLTALLYALKRQVWKDVH